jgi:hypothetical protein
MKDVLCQIQPNRCTLHCGLLLFVLMDVSLPIMAHYDADSEAGGDHLITLRDQLVIREM